jgi:hypothetical protein
MKIKCLKKKDYLTFKFYLNDYLCIIKLSKKLLLSYPIGFIFNKYKYIIIIKFSLP